MDPRILTATSPWPTSAPWDPEKLDFYRKKIAELLATIDKDRAAVANQYAKVVGKVVPELLASGSFMSEEVAFRFINDVGELGITGASMQMLQSIKGEYINKALAEAEAHYESAVSAKDPNEGILADYTLAKLMLFIDEPTPEIKSLWSKIKENNLSTYLMYDLEGLIPGLIPSINKYGVLLGIVKYVRGANSTTIQVQAYNGSTVPILFSGKNFLLVDEEGNAHAPSRTRGRFSNSKKLEPGQESAVGELTFNVGKDVPLDYLYFKGEAGESKKFLP